MSDVTHFLRGVGSVDFCEVGESDAAHFLESMGFVDFCEVGLGGVGSVDF